MSLMDHKNKRARLSMLVALAAGAALALGASASLATAGQQEQQRQQGQQQPPPGKSGGAQGKTDRGADQAQANLPEAKAIIAKYVEATGGAEAYEAQKSQHARGTFAMPMMNINGTFNIYQVHPDKFLLQIEMAGMGTVQQGLTDGIGWYTDSMQGPRLLEGAELASLKRGADMQVYLHPEQHYSQMKTEGVEEVEGKRMYKVVMTPKDAGNPTTNYFDAESGLLIRTVGSEETPMGQIQFETKMEDYKPIGEGSDLKQPHKMTISAGGVERIITIEEVKTNVEFEEGRFTPPAEVQQLIDQKKAGGNDAAGDPKGGAAGKNRGNAGGGSR